MCLLKISVSSVTLAMKLVAIAVIVSSIMLAEAEDFGVFGELFEIAEEDFMEQIQSKLMQLEKTGLLETAKKEIQRRVKEMILHPQAINGITHTKKTRMFTFDTSITIAHDLRDHRGRVFAKKGERFNPLNISHFTTQLLFIDGDDEDHINWAISKIKDYQTVGHDRAKVILVKGSPLELQKRLHRDIYFDQQGILTSKFGIKHVPAIVFQKADEKFLTILEVVAPRAITASPLAERYARCTGDIEAESRKVNESSVTLVESK